MYIYSINLELNHIGDIGVSKLIKDSWHNLNILSLSTLPILWIGFNKIGDNGAQFLSEGKWPNLNILYLSIYYFIYRLE